MRFTKVQVAFFKLGIGFVHMSKNDQDRKQAVDDFQDAIKAEGSWSRSMTRFTNDRTGTHALFKVCHFDGAAWEHTSVIFMDVKRKDLVLDADRRTYDAAQAIPADINGAGPMVIR
jgi:hypothetical protein